MKKIILLLAIFSMLFTSCDPLEDINAEIDANPSPIVGDASFTLTDEDYEELEQSDNRFNSLDDAKTALPSFLSSKYPVWGEGSSALVGFELNIGRAFDLNNFDLAQADYTTSGSDILGFAATATPEDFLPTILTTNFDSSEEGDYVAASYFQYTGTTTKVTPKVSLKDNLDYGTTTGDLTTVSGGVWENHSGAPNELLYTTESLSMTDYPSSNIGGALAVSASGSEDVSDYFTPISSGNIYASALVNLSEVSTGTYTFHLRDDSFGYRARVGAKDDGSGKILFGIGASSSSLTYGTTAFDLNTTYLLVSSYNIETGVSNLYVLSTVEVLEPSEPEATNTGSAGTIISGVSIRQGFGGPTATIDGIRVANTWSAIMSDETLEEEVIGAKDASKVIYVYTDGGWVIPSSPSDTFYLVTESDFAEMGIENFGSSTSADDYLPTFLNLKFPFALEEKELEVVYNYVSSSSGAQTRGNLYTKTSGVWVAYQSIISSSFQFGHDGTAWVPDNTIKYTLVAEDYALVSSTLSTETGYESATSNLSSFGNFNRTGDISGTTEPSGGSGWNDFMMTRALGIVLNNIAPSAEEGQKYSITTTIYDGSTSETSFNFIREGGVWIAN
jgi:hypothetical protein